MRCKYLPIKYKDAISSFPNFSITGSIKGMKKLYYGKDALLVRCGQFIYNVSSNPKIYHETAY